MSLVLLNLLIPVYLAEFIKKIQFDKQKTGFGIQHGDSQRAIRWKL